MNVAQIDAAASSFAAAIDVAPSTASVHLQRLKTVRLVKMFAQGKHRYGFTL
jgi:DNA-binding transcriptional ArsR family regulator